MRRTLPCPRTRLALTAVLALASTIATPAQPRQAPKPASPAVAPAPAVEPSRLAALEWRNIGPFRGGRVTAVAGIPGDPLVYYMGATGGGVWKTEDAGLSWKNVSDGFFKTGSVGAIAVAESDPNVVYVGMGEAPVRGVATSHGDGVYKSTDAGRTWAHVGLAATRHISMIHVHPQNADVVYVAAQGSPWGPSADRGIYRSADGGRTWTLVHTVDRTSGASDLSMDSRNPRVLYAAYWDHQRQPWFVRSGGPGSGLYKTTDGGDTWTKLAEGLPKGVAGKIAVSVSRADPNRVWALIEAEDGGLFRSDDAGASWRRVSEDRVLRARAWYYINVIADPGDANTVFVLNAPFLKSIDGGRTFATVRTPHGDNHALWINPANTRWMINGNDGGANISLDGGRSWSTQGNQPTAQFYRVSADERFPYFVYGGQQDNTTVAIASRSFGAGIDVTDWHRVGGCESASVAFDPKRPDLVYAGCYQGIITEWDRATQLERNVMAYPALGLAEPSNEQKYRFNWNAPIVVSRHDPATVYHAGNVLFRSTNRGRTWTAISPDLTRDDKSRQGPGGGPITNEGAGGEVYGTIFTLAEAVSDRGTIWVGTDDGLVHLTRDGGGTWTNVTPRDLPEAQINAIEASPHDNGTAYLAVTRYKLDDFAPYVYKTTDFGATWTRIVSGLPADAFVRVVREDTSRRDLLYAGTEAGVHVSFDGGARWQSLQQQLPIVPITDLKVHGNDLVAATQGRAFWILDDLAVLRQIEGGAADELRLFTPAPALRVDGASGGAPGLGRNPPNGAVIYYELPKADASGGRALPAAAPPSPDTRLTLDILDASGRLLRTFGTEDAPEPVDAGSGGDTPRPRPARLTTKPGLNRIVWDLRVEPYTRVPGLFSQSSPRGPRVAPGQYRARLTMGAVTRETAFEVLPDPRVSIDAAAWSAWQRMVAAVYGRVTEMHQAVIVLRDARDQINAVLPRLAGHARADEVEKAAKALVARITAWEETIVQPRQKTFQDVINFRNQLNEHYLHLGQTLDGDLPPLTDGMQQRFADLETRWAERAAALKVLRDEELPAFNALVKEAGVPAVAPRPSPPAQR